MKKFLLLVAGTTMAAAHMGISSPRPLDRAVGDNYRSPVSSNNNPTAGGACHGQTAGAKFAWVWTPKFSGTCEIYMNCFTSQPQSMAMSGGAAHGGGPCKLYKCDGGVNAIPPCTRMSLPGSFGGCTEVASLNDCTLKGVMPGGGSTNTDSTGGGAVPQPTPGKTPPGATTGRIRCGKSWGDANGKCGTQCVDDSACSTGEKCFADLNPCDGGNPPVNSGPAPTPANTVTPPAGGGNCVSKVAHISDAWCQGVNCHQVFSAFCGYGAASMMAPSVAEKEAEEGVQCQLDAAWNQMTMADMAFKWDVDYEDMKALNSDVPAETVLEEGTVLQIPGDCNTLAALVTAGGDNTDDGKTDDGKTDTSSAFTSGPVMGLVVSLYLAIAGARAAF